MRTILHCDCNNFYASVEIAKDPSLKGKPLVVCGDPQMRHGIVLAKSYEAKSCGIKTGEVLWQARKKCPPLLTITADHQKYEEYSIKVREICSRYTEKIEPFGLDENWLDVSGHCLSGEEIAKQIREATRKELGITVSIGVSYNKVFAKLASELRGADATSVISPDNYRRKVWPLPAKALLFVGQTTCKQLRAIGLYTIGDIAQAPPELLREALGKYGDTLRLFALGHDDSPVMSLDNESEIKSVSNSTTPARDMNSIDEAKPILYILADSVASRLRRHGMLCQSVGVWMRDHQLNSIIRQSKLLHATDISDEIANTALFLLRTHWDRKQPLRSLGIQTGSLIPSNESTQLPLFLDFETLKKRKLDLTLDAIRGARGHACIQRGLLMTHSPLDAINSVDDHSPATFAAAHIHEQKEAVEA